MIECDLVSEVMSAGGNLTGIRIWHAQHSLLPIKGPHDYSRFIIRVDDLVLKFNVESGPTTWSQGREEAMLSLELWPEDYKYFVEVRHTGTVKAKDGILWRWVAMPYVDEIANRPAIDQEVIRACKKKVDELAGRYEIEDLLERDFPRNWTIVNNNPLIYDYGCVPKFRRLND